MPDGEYTFDGRMAMSTGVAANEGIEAILLDSIPGALRAYPADESDDRNGVDWWVECIGYEDRNRIGVDVKARARDFLAEAGEDDLALETWSVLNQTPGWTRDPRKITDYILWWWKPTGRWCLVPFLMLCAVFSEHWQEWSARYKTDIQSTKPSGRFRSGWQSECVFVPRKIVWRSIYDRFGGDVRDVA